jgi:signal peptidase II
MGVVTQEAVAVGLLFVSAGLVLALDQASKRLVLGRAHRQLRSRRANGLTPRVRIRMNSRFGVALLPCRYALLVWGVAVLGTILLIHYAPQLQTWPTRVGFGIALGGATGNLLDLVRRGAVVDFIDLRVWPVFNIADACIVLGVGGALWAIH